MISRTFSPSPQPATPAAGPGYAPVRFLQPKLTVGPVDDPFEREADRVAERVVSRLPAGSLLAAAPALPPTVQRKSEEGEPEEKDREEEGGEVVRLKATAAPPAVPGPGLSPAVEAGILQAGGSGRPLPAPVRGAMESAFGSDFRLVRVHADSRADHLNRSLGARAFTTGRDVFFRAGEYRPDSAAGQRLLAHELTHVVQQGRGSAAGQGIVQREVCYVSGVQGPYEGVVGERNVAIAARTQFAATQRRDILTSNNAGTANLAINLANSRNYRSDHVDSPLVTKDLLTHHLAEIDHIYPESLGGGNSVRNAQVLSQYENGAVKRDTYPWTSTRRGVQYTGARVLLPDGNLGWGVAAKGVLGVIGQGANANIRLPQGSTIPQGGVLYTTGTNLAANTTLRTWMTLPQGFPLPNQAGAPLPVGVVLPIGRVLSAPLALPAGFVPAENILLPLNSMRIRITPAPLNALGLPQGPPQTDLAWAGGQTLQAGQALADSHQLPQGAQLTTTVTLPAGFVPPFDLPLQLNAATAPAHDVVLPGPVQLAAHIRFAQSFLVNPSYDLNLSAARANGLAPAAYDPL